LATYLTSSISTAAKKTVEASISAVATTKETMALQDDLTNEEAI
jgi:hypothetical protein